MKKLLFTILISAFALTTTAQSVTINELHKVVSDIRQAGAQMGREVAIDGDYAVVGARLADEDGAGNNLYRGGAAHIYKFNGTSWVHIQRITNSDREAEDFFGESVDIDGDWIIVGAPNEDHTDLGTANFLSAAGSD